MTVIKTNHVGCGDVELKPADVRLVVASVEDWSFYAFECPTCHDHVRKPASCDVVALLRSGGVMPERWVIPAEALEVHDGPPIVLDELIDLDQWIKGMETA